MTALRSIEAGRSQFIDPSYEPGLVDGQQYAVTLSWYRFSGGRLVSTQIVAVTPGSAFRVDPRNVSALADDTQYSVVADGIGGPIDGVVIELAAGGDNAMIYEGFSSP